MRTVHKYIFEPPEEESRIVHVMMPAFAEVVHVDVQNSDACIWALVDTAQPLQRWEFEVYATGAPISEARYLYLNHLGTFRFLPDGLVFHLFERKVKE